ncbi:xanthine dehydrogenase subunit D [Georgenia satyanarayanai]|uniref:xanthine dehydrogenase subunit D n=1 Tax=Georgenia satyanarayanai TaxID=860221 RepID=UPI002041F21B|nr:xanthine dehydrogenase subunit D [Georgenia satyanarayanai]MCM3660627.1 xanthine dehydrogenase subunit D [Georgenia satyanarayanai]
MTSPPRSSALLSATESRTGSGIGVSAPRPDGPLKVTGQFAYSSDLSVDGEVFGVTVRSPHPAAAIRSIDVSRALAVPGVHAVLTHEDVPGAKTYGMKVSDQPVLAIDRVRYEGEPVALVAADDPVLAAQAARLVDVVYEPWEPLLDPGSAADPGQRVVHEDWAGGNVIRDLTIRHGDMDAARAAADVVVSDTYEVGMQDQAFLGPESGLALPGEDGGVDLYISCQWLHTDRKQMAPCLDLPEDKVRLHMAGIGGAFGGKEDLSVQLHACLIALHLNRPARMVYDRRESFYGHVHRHPATMRFEHGAKKDGTIVYVKVDVLMDGGAYTSTSQVVLANCCYFVAGAYDVPNAEINGRVVYTNHPPCGAMRGFGAVQGIYGVESNMDKLAKALGMDPMELRLKNAMVEGTVLPTGQPVDGPVPVRELLEAVRDRPLPPARVGAADLRDLPGGVSNTTHGEGVRRGVGYAIGIKAIGYSGGVDDVCTARVSLSVAGGAPIASVHTAAAEMGQGVTTLQAQAVTTELGVERVVVLPANTLIGDAGSASASRMSWMSMGAVTGACAQVRAQVLERAATRLGIPAAGLALEDGVVVELTSGAACMSLAEAVGTETIEGHHVYRHRPTEPIDPETGQGNAHIAFAFCAHRAVVDVDVELGLVKVVELATAEDVGKALNPMAVEGQIHGGNAQGLGLAVMEELLFSPEGKLLNPSFTDYLIPTILDVPPMPVDIFEFPHPDSPYGLNGVGEPPNLSSTPAVLNALRDATGLDLVRAPVRPEHIVDVDEGVQVTVAARSA